VTDLCFWICSRDDNIGVLLSDEVDIANREIFADNVTSVVTLCIVPSQTIIEEVVQKSHASLITKPVLFQDTIRLSSTIGSSLGPAVKLPAVGHVGLPHGGEGGGPEPASDVVRLEPRLVTAIDLLVTQSATGPHFSHASVGHLLTNKVLLLLVLNTNQIHAPLSAVVPGREPVPSCVGQSGLVTVPGEPVGLASWAPSVATLILSFGTEIGFWKTDLSITSRIDLGSSPVSGTISCDSIPQKLASIVIIILSGWPPVVSVPVEVILRFSNGET